MAKGKGTPEKSKLNRARAPLAYSRARKGDEGDPPAQEAEAKPAEARAVEARADEAKPDEAKAAEAQPAEAKAAEAQPAEAVVDIPAPTPADAAEVTAAEITPPKPTVEPWPDATPLPMKPVEAPARARSATIAMPPEAAFGAPPALPGTVEDPTLMPAPKDVPLGNPADPMPPPGRVPSGDSRSLRRGDEFALIYRQGGAIVTRFGTVGQRGQWRVVEYPTPASASNSYAKEVSRFVGDGFVDYRE